MLFIYLGFCCCCKNIIKYFTRTLIVIMTNDDGDDVMMIKMMSIKKFYSNLISILKLNGFSGRRFSVNFNFSPEATNYWMNFHTIFQINLIKQHKPKNTIGDVFFCSVL